jgi:uncharacterized membrane protein YhaH (DUF805 family)
VSKPVCEDLFSFGGRRNRRSFVLYQLALAGALAGTVVAVLAANASMSRSLFVAALACAGTVWAVGLFSNVAVTTQRCHDLGCTGWAQVIALVPYVGLALPCALMLVPGTVGDNAYGPDPLDPARDAPAEHHVEMWDYV